MYFASEGVPHGERIAVWALNETVATKVSMSLWPGTSGLRDVGMNLHVIRPNRATNPYLRGSNAGRLLCSGVPAVTRSSTTADIQPSMNLWVGCGRSNRRCLWRGSSLRLPRRPDLLRRLAARRVTRDALMPSMDVVAGEVSEFWADELGS